MLHCSLILSGVTWITVLTVLCPHRINQRKWMWHNTCQKTENKQTLSFLAGRLCLLPRVAQRVKLDVYAFHFTGPSDLLPGLLEAGWQWTHWEVWVDWVSESTVGSVAASQKAWPFKPNTGSILKWLKHISLCHMVIDSDLHGHALSKPFLQRLCYQVGCFVTAVISQLLR